MDGNRDSAAHKRGTQMEEPSTVGLVTSVDRANAPNQAPDLNNPHSAIRRGPDPDGPVPARLIERVQRSCDSDDGLEPSLVFRGGEDTNWKGRRHL
jgi:hypothetical protein